MANPNIAHANRNSIILSDSAQQWAASNGHADDLEAAKRVRAAWLAYQIANKRQISLRNVPVEELQRRKAKLDALAAQYDAAMAGR